MDLLSKPPHPETVVVAMSGGVDSSVAAGLLREAGHRVIGVFMRNGVEAAPSGPKHRQGCCSVDDALDARRVAEQLDIPFYALNLEQGFRELIDDFVTTYSAGRTPNPCIECNRRFKMGALLELARRVGGDAVATGHYAQIRRHGQRFSVAPGLDRAKDQSYVLFPLDQETLSRTRFPLGELTKAEVRAHATRLGLKVAQKPESMEICFVPTGDYRDVVRQHPHGTLTPGFIRTSAGHVLGEHEGTELFTIGQRRGLPGGQAQPLYVVDLDPSTGTVTVGTREDLLTTTFMVDAPIFSGSEPLEAGAELRGDVQIRAHHEAVPARMTCLSDGRLLCTPEAPLASVTPGQAAVFYGDCGILLGGYIGERVRSHQDARWTV